MFELEKYWTLWQVKSQVWMLYVSTYTYKISGNIGYLLHAIYIMRCTGFVFGSKTIHW